MTKITSLDLSPFYRHTVGMDRLFDRIIEQVDTRGSNSGNYPPYNIIRGGEDEYKIQVAVAGFDESELDVEYQEGHLTIKGEQHLKDHSKELYMHNGISARDFTRSFTLADYVYVDNASLDRGILTVHLKREVPEEHQPKSIKINSIHTGSIEDKS